MRSRWAIRRPPPSRWPTSTWQPRATASTPVLRGSAIQPPLYSEDCSYSTFLPFETRMRLTLDSIVFALREMPRFHAFLEDTYYISHGGLDAVEEMSLGLLEIR